MKYYKLKKDLPTFKKGELFYISDYGNLISRKDKNVIAYTDATLTKFPNILEDWFEPVSEPERDKMTKWKFFEYLQFHKNERFFQAVRNFAKEYLGDDFNFIYASKTLQEYYVQHFDKFEDTFYMECDEMLKKYKEEHGEQS